MGIIAELLSIKSKFSLSQYQELGPRYSATTRPPRWKRGRRHGSKKGRKGKGALAKAKAKWTRARTMTRTSSKYDYDYGYGEDYDYGETTYPNTPRMSYGDSEKVTLPPIGFFIRYFYDELTINDSE